MRQRPLTIALLVATATAPAVAQQVTFTKQPSRVGEQVEQTSEIGLDIKAVTRRGAEVLEESHISLNKSQVRLVEALQLGGKGAVDRARVTFTKSQRATGEDKAEPEAIEGMTYVCERQGQALRVVRDDGSQPTPEEFRLVSDSMASLGKPNPLADYFEGRTLTVGEKVSLPPEVGAQLVAAEAVGKVTRFEITLTEIAEDGDTKLATLKTLIETKERSSRQLGLVVTGEMVVETNTCRTRSLELSGPLAMAETTGGIGTPVQLYGTGKMSVAMAATVQQK